MADVRQINGYALKDAPLRADIADNYDATVTYAVNDYVLESGQLYKCNTAVDTPEAFDPIKWDDVKVTDEMITAVNVAYEAATESMTIS